VFTLNASGWMLATSSGISPVRMHSCAARSLSIAGGEDPPVSSPDRCHGAGGRSRGPGQPAASCQRKSQVRVMLRFLLWALTDVMIDVCPLRHGLLLPPRAVKRSAASKLLSCPCGTAQRVLDMLLRPPIQGCLAATHSIAPHSSQGGGGTAGQEGWRP
jgi:hypothetical protein